MKRLITLLFALGLILSVAPASIAQRHSTHSTRTHASGSVAVRGYTTRTGKYVAPHRSHPNNTQRDNWSAKGNVNPYTFVPKLMDDRDSCEYRPSTHILNSGFTNAI